MAGDVDMRFTSPIRVRLAMVDDVRAETAVAIAAEFAAWLEREGFDIDPVRTGVPDTRSRAELARDFVAQWKERA